jgi:hypothetical protein
MPRYCAPMNMKTPNPDRSRRALWFGVILAFALLIGANLVFFVVAAHHPVAEVPLVTAPPR